MLGLSRKTARPPSKNEAVGRLKVVLTADRVAGAAGMLEQMKNDILEVMRRYVVINDQDIDIQVLPQGVPGDATESKLRANIPVKNIKTQNHRA